MSLAQITEQMTERMGAGGQFKKSVKFDFGADGLVRIDDTVSPVVVSNEDGPTACSIKVTMADFMDIATGKQNAQMAFMMIEAVRIQVVGRYGGVRGELGWVLDDNQGMVAIADAINSKVNREYLIYEKAL